MAAGARWNSSFLADDGHAPGANIIGYSIADLPDGPVRYAGIWDRIRPDACRWRQVSSTDGGRTWVHHWIMDWQRAA